MNTDHGLKVGDKIKPTNGLVYDVLEVEGRFALVKDAWSGNPFPIVCDDGVWCARIGGHPWTVVEPPRWRADVHGTTTLIYDGNRVGAHYDIAVFGVHIAVDADEVVEAIVGLPNERFPA